MTRVAIVTGGTRGIGAAVSVCLAKAGYVVAANFVHNTQAAAQFAEHTGIRAFQWDASRLDECRRGVEEVAAALGPIGVLVNNAGITRDKAFERMTEEDWSTVMTTNLSSAFFMSSAVIPAMRRHGFGRIINISSINGQKGQRGQVNYSTAKAGLFGMTKALALEYASRNITVNAVAPGYIDTDLLRAAGPDLIAQMTASVPTGRLGTPEEVARSVEFLASDAAAYITGATITVNGGAYMC